MKQETKSNEDYTSQQAIEEFENERKGNTLVQNIVGLLGIHGMSVLHEGYSNKSHITEKFEQVIKEYTDQALAERDAVEERIGEDTYEEDIEVAKQTASSAGAGDAIGKKYERKRIRETINSLRK